LSRSGLALCLLLGLAAPLAAQVQPAQPRAGITLTVESAPPYQAALLAAAVLQDPSLEDAVRSGIPLRLGFRVELWRDRLFDRLEATRAWTAVVVFDPLDRLFLLRQEDAPPGANPAAVRFTSFEAVRSVLEATYRPEIRPAGSGRFYYTAVLEVETLSLSDLDELQRWLSGELQPAVAGDRAVSGALGVGARRLVIRLLRLPTRRFESRSSPFTVR
jgi:hypothetical protein